MVRTFLEFEASAASRRSALRSGVSARPVSGRGSEGGQKRRKSRKKTQQQGKEREGGGDSGASQLTGECAVKGSAEEGRGERERADRSCDRDANRAAAGPLASSRRDELEDEASTVTAPLHHVSRIPSPCRNAEERRANGDLLADGQRVVVLGQHEVENEAKVGGELDLIDSSWSTQSLHPLHVISKAHQSGVNCLLASFLPTQSLESNDDGVQEGGEPRQEGLVCVVVSGGDDEAVHVARVSVEFAERSHLDSSTGAETTLQSDGCMLMGSSCGSATWNDLRIVSVKRWKHNGAHSAAVKGLSAVSSMFFPVLMCFNDIFFFKLPHFFMAHFPAGLWTNGKSVISVGMDQRVRCWDLALPQPTSTVKRTAISQEHVNEACESAEDGPLLRGAILKESGWCVTDVPEVENLDVWEAAEGR